MNGIRKNLKFVPVINYAMLLVLLVNAFKTLTSSNKRSLLIKLVVISFLVFAISSLLVKPLTGVLHVVARACVFYIHPLVLCLIAEKESAAEKPSE